MLCEEGREPRNIYELIHTKLNRNMVKPIAAVFFKLTKKLIFIYGELACI